MSEDLIQSNEGTPWSAWQHSAHLARATWVSAQQLCPPGRRLVLIAPHPDDEILMAGGLLADFAGREEDLVLISATDGEGSHPGSTRWTEHRLRRDRPQESRKAIEQLGLDPKRIDWRRLHLKDSQLAREEAFLVSHLTQLLRPEDVLMTTWRGDGHCDHEAVGRAGAQAALARKARLVEVPVWAWHWGQPEDPRLPWERAHRLQLNEDQVGRKRKAIAAHVSQFEPDGCTPPVLRPNLLDCVLQPFELVFL